MIKALRAFCRDESGHTAIEYGLIAVCVAVGIILGVQAIGVEVSGIFDEAADGFKLRP